MMKADNDLNKSNPRGIADGKMDGEMVKGGEVTSGKSREQLGHVSAIMGCATSCFPFV